MHKQALSDGVVAGAVAGALSGAPSTAAALVGGRDPLEASLAAGALLLPHETRASHLLAAAVPTHLGISLAWGMVLAIVLPRRKTAVWGAVAGLGIAALDLGVVGRRHDRIRALPAAPQVADHIAYGFIVGLFLHRRRTRRGRLTSAFDGPTPTAGSEPPPEGRRRRGLRRSRRWPAAPQW